MIRLLIVDSDMETLRNFQAHLKQAFPELKDNKVFNDARRDFVAAVRDVKPNLIVMDVRFFGGKVVAVIRDIHERYPDIRFLLYGSLNEFEYISKGMEFGVLDYMYRPVRASEFIRCMKNAIEYIESYHAQKENERRLLNEISAERSLFQKIFFDSLLGGKLTNNDEIESKLHYFGIKLAKPNTAISIRIDNYQKLILAMDESEKNLAVYRIILLIGEAFKAHRHIVNIYTLNEIGVILCGDLEYNEIILLCEALKMTVYEKLSIRVSIGVGNKYADYSDIAVSFKEAQGALRYRFYMGYNSVIPIRYVEPNNKITYRYPIEYENKLVYAAVIGEYEICEKMLNEIFAVLKASEPLPDRLLPKIIMDILISINRYASEQGIILNDNFNKFFPSKSFLEIKEADKALEYFRNALKDFCYYIVELHDTENLKLFAKIRNYIDIHYKTTFTIESLAMEFDTTPAYLSKVFLDNENISVSDYVNLLRIADAKRLIRETGLDDGFIAVGVGYRDARQLRNIFMLYEKVSLSDFRRQISYQNIKFEKK